MSPTCSRCQFRQKQFWKMRGVIDGALQHGCTVTIATVACESITLSMREGFFYLEKATVQASSDRPQFTKWAQSAIGRIRREQPDFLRKSV